MFEAVLTIFVLFASVVLHEYAHGWAAYKLGDPTAKMAGRLTLNPIMHVDPVGTIFIPGVLITLRFLGVHILGMEIIPIGWAKPVPVNFGRLNNPRRDMIWVGLAGPAVNITLAIIISRFAQIFIALGYYQFVKDAVFINLLLATFNMIPIPPLDGSRLLMGILPRALAVPYSRLECYGLLIVVLLVSMGVFENVVLPVVVLAGKLLGMEF